MATQITKNPLTGTMTVTTDNPAAIGASTEAIIGIATRMDTIGLQPHQVLEALGKGRGDFDAFGIWCRVYSFLFRFLPTWLAATASIFSLYTLVYWLKNAAYPTLKEWIADIPVVGAFIASYMPDETERDEKAGKVTPESLNAIIGAAVPTWLGSGLAAVAGARAPSTPVTYGPPSPYPSTNLVVNRPGGGFRTSMLRGMQGTRKPTPAPAPASSSRSTSSMLKEAAITKGIDILGKYLLNDEVTDEERRFAEDLVEDYDNYMDETNY